MEMMPMGTSANLQLQVQGPNPNQLPQAPSSALVRAGPVRGGTPAMAVAGKDADAGSTQPRSQKEMKINCPRCNSANTKFCYYNNYSLLHPCYFCKTCRRSWTVGGWRRHDLVGGGSRGSASSSYSMRDGTPAIAVAGKDADAGSTQPRSQKEMKINCPRCNSANTKFCYYNNYSLLHPCYSCKTCRRSWTVGGSRRHVLVGGGSRGSSSSLYSVQDGTPAIAVAGTSNKNLKLAPDLNLASPHHHSGMQQSERDLEAGTIQVDGDGDAATIQGDANGAGDGYAATIQVDADGDGDVATIQVDADGDGVAAIIGRLSQSFVPGASLSRAQVISRLFLICCLILILDLKALCHGQAAGPLFGRYPAAYYILLAVILALATVGLAIAFLLSCSKQSSLAFAKPLLPFALILFLVVVVLSGFAIPFNSKVYPVR